MSEPPDPTRTVDETPPDPLDAGLAAAFGPDPDLPREVGRYRIEGEIDHGGMGLVLRGRDPALNCPLAIKVLLDKYRGHADAERRLLDEAQITAQLQHPGVPPVHEVGRLDDGRPFFTMKLVKGRTLAELLRERRDTAEDLPRFLAVCQTLAYAHSRGVIHRDIKPSNIMVGAFGEIQVMDWGLAKPLAQQGPAPTEAPSTVFTVRTTETPLSRGDAVVGTVAYMAPEQARAEAHLVDERADVFGLGALLCVLLTGQPPYADADWDWVYRQAARADLADAFARLDACGADAELVRLAKRCLTPDREQRPRDASEVADAVVAYQAGVEARARKAEPERGAGAAWAEEAKATAQAEQARAEEAEAKAAAQRARAAEAEARTAAERRARRLTMGMAAAALLLVVGGGSVAWVAVSRTQEAGRKARD